MCLTAFEVSFIVWIFSLFGIVFICLGYGKEERGGLSVWFVVFCVASSRGGPFLSKLMVLRYRL